MVLLSREGRTPSSNGAFMADFVGNSNDVAAIVANESLKVGDNALATLNNALVLSLGELMLLSGGKEMFHHGQLNRPNWSKGPVVASIKNLQVFVKNCNDCNG